MEKRFVYADNAATTPVIKPVLDAMIPYYSEYYGNPSSVYHIGMSGAMAIEKARREIAECIGASPAEIYFTSCGTESDNWAIKSAAHMRSKKGKHIISSCVEHHAVLHSLKALEKEGFEVTYLPVDSEGNINTDELKAAIREDTILISVMTANNEIGTIMPVNEIGKIAREHSILFHTDAVQAVGHIKIDVNEIGCDLLCASAHKFHGPKGVGFLYMKKGVSLPPYLDGGGQERSKRGGTENVAGIVGMATALKLACENIDEKIKSISAKRDRLLDELSKIPYSAVTGPRENRLPGTASFVFECIEGESMVLNCDLNGICASSGSACSSGDLDPSHVLLAIGLKHEVAHGSLRLSISDLTTDEDIDYILEVVPKVVEKLRSMSPMWEDLMKEKAKEN